GLPSFHRPPIPGGADIPVRHQSKRPRKRLDSGATPARSSVALGRLWGGFGVIRAALWGRFFLPSLPRPSSNPPPCLNLPPPPPHSHTPARRYAPTEPSAQHTLPISSASPSPYIRTAHSRFCRSSTAPTGAYPCRSTASPTGSRCHPCPRCGCSSSAPSHP